MLSKALLAIGILGIIWIVTGCAISMRHRTVSVNLPKLVLCAVIILLAFLASIAANSNGW
ncbi:MAG: hypothetical protein WAP51_03510 [Candidatus Sungiibacteriota bacterium]